MELGYRRQIRKGRRRSRLPYILIMIKKVTVTLGPRAGLETLAALCRCGLIVDSILDDIGVVSGLCDDSTLGALGQITGVAHVEVQRAVTVV